MVSADKPWEEIGEASGAVASPTGDKDGNVIFSDAAANRIYKVDLNGRVNLFKDHSSGATALRSGPEGRLYSLQPDRKRIVSYGPGGDEKLVARGVEATDIVVTAKSSIYFIDAVHKTIGFIDAQRRTRSVYDGGDIAMPFGLTLSPDQAMLIVTDGESRFSWSFHIAADRVTDQRRTVLSPGNAGGGIEEWRPESG